jgi:hypothetical protein
VHKAVVAQFEIASKNQAVLRRFYAGLFGRQSGLDAAIRGADHGGVSFYVEVDDVLENLSYAEELGGRIVELPHEIMSGGRPVTIAAFADPEGNRIGLSNGFPHIHIHASAAHQSAA